MVNRKRLVHEFITLLKIDSESGNEKAISDYLIRKLTDMDLIVIEDNYRYNKESSSGNIVATLETMSVSRNHPSIFFCSHMDTVSPGRNVQPIVEGDIIRSDGTTILGSDNKAGIAVIIEALNVIKEQSIEHGRLQFIFTVCEEKGLLGAKNLSTNLLNSDYGYVLDGNGDIGDIMLTSPGRSIFQIEVKGRQAHSSINPEDGISAIQVAAKGISLLNLGNLTANSTMNIHKFVGESPSNLVCDKVLIEGEIRSTNDKTIESIASNLDKVFEKVCAVNKCEYSISNKMEFPPYVIGNEEDVVENVIKAMTKLGIKNNLIKNNVSSSDANILNNYGIPTLNLGMGYQGIHTTNEFYRITNLVKITNLILNIIRNSKMHQLK